MFLVTNENMGLCLCIFYWLYTMTYIMASSKRGDFWRFVWTPVKQLDTCTLYTFLVLERWICHQYGTQAGWLCSPFTFVPWWHLHEGTSKRLSALRMIVLFVLTSLVHKKIQAIWCHQKKSYIAYTTELCFVLVLTYYFESLF